LDHRITAAELFISRSASLDIREHGNGNINDTFLVTTGSKAEERFILQRINTRVFRHPELVMRNMRAVTEHVLERLRQSPPGDGRRWETPRVLLTRDGRSHWIDPDGSFWRAISFISSSMSFDTIQDMVHAREVGHALGFFHKLISDLPSERLADTLEGFHVTAEYLRHYDEALAAGRVSRVSADGISGSGMSAYRMSESRAPRSTEVEYCHRFVSERRHLATVLEDAKAQGRLPLRPIHGDPKVNNVLIDTSTRRAVSIVDLDTVKPGLVHYDIGDCLRSACNPLGEETDRWETVRFEADLCRAILMGYLPEARDFLLEQDYKYLYDAVRLIAFELGLRFFTDYLEGNVYFKVKHEEQNLARALVQLKLAESIESQAAAIHSIIRDMR
jgi:hypothetical protein